MSLLGRLHHRVVFRRRVRVLAEIVSQLLPGGARVLDVGCGDGSVAAGVLARRPDLTIRGLEVAPRPQAAIVVEAFDGLTIPRDDGAVDAVLLVDVLHHARNPEALLREAVRVASGPVIVKDHLLEGFLAGPTLRLMDWVGNAPHGVELRWDYWTRDRWEAAFRRLGVAQTRRVHRLGLYPPPLDWIFGRSLHFVARLEPEAHR